MFLELALTLPVVLVPQQSANPRYELGVRTRALERAWIAATPELRASVLPQVEGAVQRFFAMDMAGVGAALDEARTKLERSDKPWALERFTLTPARKLLDVTDTSVKLTLGNLYTTDFAAPVVLTASFDGRPLKLEPARVEAPGRGETRELVLSLESLPKGAAEVTVEIELANEGDLRSRRRVSFSRAVQRDERLRAVKAALIDVPDEAPALEFLTAQSHLVLLEQLGLASQQETDYPATRLLSECETILGAIADNERWFGPASSGSSWLTLPNGANGAQVRVFVPEKLVQDQLVPLVVALHGAGGSENMFFDAYGDGRIVELCRQRGWVLVAPRVSFLGAPVEAVVTALAERLPIDRTKVFVVGHSMGAGVGQQVVAKKPADFRAFAALGGGSGLRDASALASKPIFVGAGERDFGRRGAEALHKSLVGAGSEVATLHIYPNCEHLMVVVDALPDVFAFFDAQLASK